MGAPDPTGKDWSDRDVDLIVADYFEMLDLEIAQKPYVKAHRNAALHEITGRSKGSIEFKHQNISAVLVKLGLPWIIGYKPMANFQHALIDGIERYLSSQKDQPGILNSIPPLAASGTAIGLHEEATLHIEPAPQLSQADLEIPIVLSRLIRKFDPAERDARNRNLGRTGEEFVFGHERAQLMSAGREDLARKVRWVSQEDGDGAGYDIASFDRDGRERLVEVKTTIGHITTPFYLSENERAFSEVRPEAFRIMRLYDFVRTPRALELAPPLESQVILKPTNYRASFE